MDSYWMTRAITAGLTILLIGCGGTEIRQAQTGRIVNERFSEEEIPGARVDKGLQVESVDITFRDPPQLVVRVMRTYSTRFKEFKDWDLAYSRSMVTKAGVGGCAWNVVMSPLAIMASAVDPNADVVGGLKESCAGKSERLDDYIESANPGPVFTGRINEKDIQVGYGGVLEMRLNGTVLMERTVSDGLLEVALPELERVAGAKVAHIDLHIPGQSADSDRRILLARLIEKAREDQRQVQIDARAAEQRRRQQATARAAVAEEEDARPARRSASSALFGNLAGAALGRYGARTGDTNAAMLGSMMQGKTADEAAMEVLSGTGANARGSGRQPDSRPAHRNAELLVAVATSKMSGQNAALALIARQQGNTALGQIARFLLENPGSLEDLSAAAQEGDSAAFERVVSRVAARLQARAGDSNSAMVASLMLGNPDLVRQLVSAGGSAE